LQCKCIAGRGSKDERPPPVAVALRGPLARPPQGDGETSSLATTLISRTANMRQHSRGTKCLSLIGSFARLFAAKKRISSDLGRWPSGVRLWIQRRGEAGRDGPEPSQLRKPPILLVRSKTGQTFLALTASLDSDTYVATSSTCFLIGVSERLAKKAPRCCNRDGCK